jgi:hypothetical protein
VFGRVDGDLAVNLFLAARLDWPERGMTVRMDADLFASDTVTLHLTARVPVESAVRIRRPGWAHDARVEVDGEPVAARPDGGYLVVRRTWSGDHTVTVRFRTGLAVDRLPDGSPWVALRWGPVVLAARDGADRLDGLLAGDERMGHIAHGPTRPLAATPVVGTDDPLDAAVLRTRSPLVVDLTVVPHGAGSRATVRLEPFAAIHDERYTVLWPVGADVETRRAQLAAADAAASLGPVGDAVAGAHAEAVVDEVVAGEQQPESDHAFAGEHTRAHAVHGTHSRSATGWFSYALRDPAAAGRTLRLTFDEPDPDDPRAHEVRVNGVVLGEPAATRAGDGVVDVDHVVDATVRAADPDGRLVVAVHARDGLPTGELLRVRLLGGPA